ncbi:hypothetical protein KUCAC02_034059, partial [Chaenocephalus aceratus]
HTPSPSVTLSVVSTEVTSTPKLSLGCRPPHTPMHIDSFWKVGMIDELLRHSAKTVHMPSCLTSKDN